MLHVYLKSLFDSSDEVPDENAVQTINTNNTASIHLVQHFNVTWYMLPN